MKMARALGVRVKVAIFLKDYLGFLPVRFLFFSIILFLFPTLGGLPLVYAYERISNPYQASILIEDRSSGVRDKAISSGLEQVLIRYTGYSGISHLNGVHAELQKAASYVIEYGVETVTVPDSDQIGIEQADALWVRYNAGLVDALVERLELPIWPTLRPTISYLMVIERWGKPQIVTPVDLPSLDAHLETLFARRGLVGTRFADQALLGVSPNQIWTMNDRLMQQLKSRSQSDILLVIRATPQFDRSYDLSLIIAGEGNETVINTQAENLFSAVNRGVDLYVDSLSAGLSFLGGAKIEQEFYLDILGMRSYPEYKKVLNQIAGLEQVVSARMSSAEDRSVKYSIRYQSDLGLLLDAIIAITGLKKLDDFFAENTLNGVQLDAGNEMSLLKQTRQLGTAEAPLIYVYPQATFDLKKSLVPLPLPSKNLTPDTNLSGQHPPHSSSSVISQDAIDTTDFSSFSSDSSNKDKSLDDVSKQQEEK